MTALNIYQKGGSEYNYASINKFVREASNDISDIIKTNPEDPMVKIINELDRNMTQSGDNSVVFYRGLDNGLIPLIIEVSSGVLVNKSYSSCTTVVNKAKEFVSDSGCCILAFTIPPGVKYHKFVDQRENEVLLERNTQFIINEKDSNHPIYSATLTKWDNPISNEIIPYLSEHLSTECKKVGILQFIKNRKQHYIAEGEDSDDAEFFAEKDSQTYCPKT